MNCVVCGKYVDPAGCLDHIPTHPGCLTYDEPSGEDPFSVMLKGKLTEIIKWYDQQNPRSTQLNLGPSEIGDPCDRRMGYRLAGIDACNTNFDPWAAIVGTAMHSWLDKAVSAWCQEHDSTDWSTEVTLSINKFVEGHSDLYNRPLKAVIDWKGAGPSVMKKLQSHDPSAGYQIQTHLYGYGFEQHGWPVERVCLVFLPRAGRLRDMKIWSAPYDRNIAEQALKRPYRIAREVVTQETLIHPNKWNDIAASPSDSCGFCPWYNSMKEKGQPADDKGCPGR